MFSSYEGQQGAVNGQDSWGVFQGCTGLRMDAGSCAGFTSSRPPPPWTVLEVLIERDLSVLLLRTLAVGR